MSSRHNLICFAVLATVAIVTGSYGTGTINNVLTQDWNGVVDYNTFKRESSKNCPPPPGQGILQVSTDDLDSLPINRNKSALDNLRYMCGHTQIIKKVPVSWHMVLEDEGPPTNVTMYSTTVYNVPLCCPGYIRNENDICVPKCKGGCKDGVCVSPGNCACYQGYGENRRGECVLTCPCKCPNGKCHGNRCFCDPGYDLNPVSQTCDPVCPDPCENAECTAPGVCTCLPGYKKTVSEEDNICSPDCGKKCANGKCIAPNVCKCNEGFMLSKSGKCVPRCAGCEHGKCVAPYMCLCHDGYRRVADECEPVCHFQCYNATCTAPHTCGCISGYVKVSPVACVPECNPACKNADCVAPNQCQCHTNYYKSNSNHFQHICVHSSIQLISAAAELANDLRNK